jgi:predicted anti-sigma-YlaC factor YlaD
MSGALSRRVALFAAFILLSSCSVKKYAVHQLSGVLAGLSPSFASDDDPELVRAAIPFSLKLIESLLVQAPKDKELLLSAATGFTQYSYAFVQEDADELQDTDRARSQVLRTRAKNLYIRARNYGLRGLEVDHKDFLDRLKADPKATVKELKKADVPLMYWTAAAWASALSVSKDFAMLPEIPRFEALADRVLEIYNEFDEGAIHGFLIIYEMSRLNPKPDRFAIAKAHFDRNIALSMGHQAGPLVSYAENVDVPQKNKAEFQDLLNRALKVDVNTWPEHRQLNLVMQRRARWLLSRTDKLFPPGS